MSKPPFTNIHVGLKTGGRPCLHEKKIIFGTSVTVMNDNLMEVVSEGFINILKEKGCKIVLYIEYVPADGVDVENAFDDPERLLMEQKLNELRNTYKDIIFISLEHGGSDKTAEEQQKQEAMEFKSKHLKNERNSSFRVNR